MKRFEYHVYDVQPEQLTEQLLDSEGKQGWELVTVRDMVQYKHVELDKSIVPYPGQVLQLAPPTLLLRLIFKREDTD